MKNCFKCGIAKPLEEFYKHPEMKDGHFNKCKSCTKTAVSSNYRDKIDKYKQYELDRNQTAGRRAAQLRYSQEKRKRNPEKYKAWNAVSNALRDGKLVRQPCEKCGNPRVDGHHEDYDKPLEVTWLCRQCHQTHHKVLIARAT